MALRGLPLGARHAPTTRTTPPQACLRRGSFVDPLESGLDFFWSPIAPPGGPSGGRPLWGGGNWAFEGCKALSQLGLIAVLGLVEVPASGNFGSWSVAQLPLPVDCVVGWKSGNGGAPNENEKCAPYFT